MEPGSMRRLPGLGLSRAVDEPLGQWTHLWYGVHGCCPSHRAEHGPGGFNGEMAFDEEVELVGVAFHGGSVTARLASA